jgi:hypothetical protein
MSASSTLDPDAVAGSGTVRPPGQDSGALGPSDVSDTGSDSVGQNGYGAAILGSDSDSAGTGVDPSPAAPGRRARRADIERADASDGDAPDETGEDSGGVELPDAESDEDVDEGDEGEGADKTDDPDAR